MVIHFCYVIFGHHSSGIFRTAQPHRFSTFKSRFSTISQRSIRKPCGLLSDRMTSRKKPCVTRSRVTTLVVRVIRIVP
jgi:hypothetical protein